MPRIARADTAGICYHALNRGNGRAEVFHKPEDFKAFQELLVLAVARVSMRLLSFCLMPNHFHLVLWPREEGDLSRFMQWLLTSHVRRYHKHYHSDGHVWQGRFKGFPIQQDEHLLAVMRYVERNPLRANMVDRAQDWQWSSLPERKSGRESELLFPCPVELPGDWTTRVNRAQNGVEEEAIRRSIVRGKPYGSERWTKLTATRLGLQSTLNPRGRPRKK